MKFWQRLLCALCAFSFCLGVSCVSANAAELNIPAYYVFAESAGPTGSISSSMIYMDDGEATLNRSNVTFEIAENSMLFCTMYLGSLEGDYLFEADRPAKIVIENIYCRFALSVNGTTIYLDDNIDYQVRMEYLDGTLDYNVTKELITHSDGYTDLTASFTPSAEVSKFHITYYVDLGSTNLVALYGGDECTAYITFGEMEADKHYLLTADQQSEEAGLLERLLDKLQGVWDSIIELPAKIWERMEEGLKALFIPSNEVLEQFLDDYSLMLEEKYGAVWEVAQLTFDSWDQISVADEQNTIEFPLVTIPLPENNSFSFGGYDVQIVPEGFEFLATAVKSIIGIVCTFTFINGVRKRYDEIMGVEQ